MQRDTVNLRHDAEFETQLYKDVFWVPVNVLGKSRYSNEDMKELAKLTPEEKRAAVSTLYEAVQLYQVGGFEIFEDNIRITEDGIEWEHHKPGYYSVFTNRGCCASSASWLTYIIEGKYGETGLITMTKMTGNAHVLNYIRRDDCIYILDMYGDADKFVHSTCAETGEISDYRKTKIISGVCFKTHSFDAFADFYAKFMYMHIPEYLFFLHKTKFLCPGSLIAGTDVNKILMPDDLDISLIHQKRKVTRITYEFVAPPKKIPSWDEYTDNSSKLSVNPQD